jgi:hypothetical protein
MVANSGMILLVQKVRADALAFSGEVKIDGKAFPGNPDLLKTVLCVRYQLSFGRRNTDLLELNPRRDPTRHEEVCLADAPGRCPNRASNARSKIEKIETKP